MAHSAFDIASLVATILAAVFAGIAAWFGWKAPTKKDLERVEKNTATTSTHLEHVHTNIKQMDSRFAEQQARDVLNVKAQQISIAVRGEDDWGTPLHLRLALKDPKVSLSRLDLYNEDGTHFGSAECEEVDPLVFSATIDPGVAMQWYFGGTELNMVHRRLSLRTHMILGGQELYRQFAVRLAREIKYRDTPSHPYTSITVEGNV